MIPQIIPTSQDEPTKAPPLPRGVVFIPIREAAFRSGWPIETIAGRCRREWAAVGLAKIEPHAETGRPAWHVREDAERAFARVKSPADLPFDVRGLSRAQRQAAERRKSLLDAWLEARAEGFDAGKVERELTESFIVRSEQGGERVSRPTLFRWLRSYSSKGLQGLVDGRAIKLKIDPHREAFERLLERLYLARRRSKRLCFDRAIDAFEEQGRPVPYGYKQASRFLDSLDKKAVCLHREGPRAFDAKFGNFVRRSHDAASNEVWMSDGHRFDVQVMFRGKAVRPVLVSWMDVRSRYIVGYSIEPRSETSDAVRLALKRGIEAHGTPVSVYHDNGNAFDAEQLQGVTKKRRQAGQRPQIDLGIFPRLGVEVIHSKAFNPKAKGELERFHRTINQRFTCELPGYMSGNPLDKPHTHANEVKGGRLLGFDEFCQAFADWIVADYHSRPHTGDGMDGKAPADVFAKNMRAKRSVDPTKIELELCRRTRVNVGRNGVTIVLHGKSLGYEHAMLDRCFGETVDVVIDDDRLQRVSVYRLDGSLLCEASSLAEIPMNATPEQLREAMNAQRRKRRLTKELLSPGMRLADDPLERMRRKADEARANSPVPIPEVYKPVRPPGPSLRIADAADEFMADVFDYERYADLDRDEAVNE